MSNMGIGIALIVLSVLLFFGGMYFVFIFTRHVKVRVRDPLNKSSYIKDVWCMEKKDKKTGAIWWKNVFWHPRFEIHEPPKEAIDVGVKGRKHIEVYRIGEDEYTFINDPGIEGTIEGKQILKTFKPFSTVQRQIIVSQFAKAEEMRPKNFFKDVLLPVGGIGVMGLVIIMLIVFWGDIAKPGLEFGAMAKNMQEKNAEMMKYNALIAKSLGAKLEGLEVEIVQSPTSKISDVIVKPGDEEAPKE